ncbi:MAG: DNA alkylation repair protein [Nitrosomonadales bacterium]|nr:DNA alkylation repair protein [Nitrosomonadales bacterium]
MTTQEISKLLRNLADPVRAEHSVRYFKTGPGEYGEGDRFLGIRVPDIRTQVKKSEAISLEDIQMLLVSAFHEERLFALLLLVRKFAKGDEKEKTAIYNLYLNNTHRINNWDLVDSSASYIVGGYLESRDKQILYKLAKSASVWERRIAVISTFHFIGKNQFDDALKLAMQFLNDEEDLIHKAVGWMLREIGKRNVAVEKAFLQAHYKKMPRTMLRYAIEKFPEQERKKYLLGEALI